MKTEDFCNSKKLKRYSKILGKSIPLILIILYAAIYLLLPTSNSGIDAYNYAANVKWNHDLFFPHHLLYNYFHYWVYRILLLIHLTPEVLSLMKMVNSMFAAFALYVFYLIINLSVKSNEALYDEKPIYLILFAASSFGFMRYATENETYIIPIFWSLLASYFFLCYLLNEQWNNLILSGLMGTIACLFHQIHFFWYTGFILALILYKKQIFNTFLILLPSLLIPIIYYTAFQQQHFEFVKAKNMWQFVFYDYFYGTANTNLGFQNLILGFIGFIRNFVQLHGIIPLLIKKIPQYIIVFIPVLLFIFKAFQGLFTCRIKKIPPDIFTKTHLMIFCLLVGFAIFSEGNAEFMVALPLLSVLIINGFIQIQTKVYLYISLAMLSWNIGFGLFPNHLYDFQNQGKTIEFISSSEKAIFILSDDVLVQNIIYYQTGVRWKSNIYKSPSSLKLLQKKTESLAFTIDSNLRMQTNVFTDCINEPFILSRKTWLQKNENEMFFNHYKIQKVDSVSGFTGIKYLFQIKEEK